MLRDKFMSTGYNAKYMYFIRFWKKLYSNYLAIFHGLHINAALNKGIFIRSWLSFGVQIGETDRYDR
jgi:hypothetical protein